MRAKAQEENVPLGIDPGVSEVLAVCEKAEFACAELYHHFAALFKEDREIFHLWLTTALEEENRARLLALVGKLRHDNVVASVELELAEAEVALLHVRALVDQVKEHPPTIRQALEMGMELEMKMDRMMRENIIKFADESYDNSFFSKINKTHMELLRQAFRKLEESENPQP